MDSLLEKQVPLDALMPLIRERLENGQSVQFSPKGTSMLPMLRQGIDTVTLSPAPAQLKKYDLPMYVGPSGKYVMHRIVDVREDHYVCLGDNTYAYEKVRPEQIVAVVCAFYRGDKRIPVDAPGYRLYCRVWCAAYPIRRFLRKVKHGLWRRPKCGNRP